MSLKMDAYTNGMIKFFKDLKDKGIEPILMPDSKIVLVRMESKFDDDGNLCSKVITAAPTGNISDVRGQPVLDFFKVIKEV